MLFLDENNTVAYLANDTIHTTTLSALLDAYATEQEELEVGPHPFNACTTQVDLAEWLRDGHDELDPDEVSASVFEVISAWADWLDEVLVETSLRGDDDTTLSREFVDYSMVGDADIPDTVCHCAPCSRLRAEVCA